MKRAFALLLALCLLLSLAACGEPEATKDRDKQTNSSQTSTTQPQELGTKTIYVLVCQKTESYADGVLCYSESITNYYDANGLLTKQERTDKDGKTETYTAELDKYGRVVSLTYAGEGITKSYTYKYDRWGNVARERFDREVDYLNKSWTYDADGNLLNYEEKDLFTTISEQYTYENGRLHSIVKYYGKTETGTRIYDYDEQGRVANISYYDPGEDTPWCSYVYSYSEDGLTTYADRKSKNPTLEQRLTTVVDAYGNIIREEDAEGGRTTVIEYTYQAIEVPADYPRKN